MSRKGSRLAVRPRILITAILLLAFGLRVIKPDFLGLNDDEAFFVQIAHLGTYLDAMRSSEPHPPLYLALLQGWMDVAGVTEYGIRFLSILTGVAMVAAMYQLGKQVLGEALGLAAAFAAALNPYQILYSQTARNYEMACLFGALSFVALLRARRDARLIPGFVICALLALYSHYYTIAIVGFEALLVASWLWGRPWPSWRPWVAAAGVVALLYVPWLLFVARTIAGYNPGHGDPDIVWRAFNDSFHYYGFGQAFDPSAIFWPGIGIALLVVLGIAGLALLSRRALGLSIGYQLAPILGGMATFVHTNQYGPRFIFIGQPGFLLIAGGAVLLLSRLQWAQLAPLAFISYLGGQAVYNTVLTDRFVTEGYRPLASYLARHISAGDAVILDGISQWNQYWYYAILRNGVTNRVEFMPKDASGGGADMTTVDRPKTESALASVAATVPGLWFIDADSLRYDPNMLTENLLAQHWYQAITTHFVYQRLQYYSTAAPAQLAAKDATEGDLRLKQASPLPARVAAGQPLTVSLVWDTVRTGPAAFKESLRLIAPDGTIAAQQDEAPWGGFFQASTWRPGNLLTDNHALVVPVGTVPGAYEVQIVAYEGRSGKGLGDPVSLGKVDVDHSLPQQVAASDLPRLGTPNDCGIQVTGPCAPLQASGPACSGATIAGECLVAAHLGASPVVAGAKLPVELLWTGGSVVPQASVDISFGGTTISHTLGGQTYPSNRWLANDVVRDAFQVRVPGNLAAGSYPLKIGSASLGDVQVTAGQHVFTRPAGGRPLNARFGSLTELDSYNETALPDAIHISLIWHVLTETDVSYKVFIHVLGDDGRIVSQVDVAPGTDQWVSGEYVSAGYDIPNPVGAGAKTIEIGLYDERSGQRLPACSGAGSACTAPADHIELPAL